jgi:arabinan endo-1,5-alpha-L-arabinosidase
MSRLSVFGCGLVAAVGFAVALSPAASASTARPVPVYGHAADPGVVQTEDELAVFTTGSLAPVSRSKYAGGPWTSPTAALSQLGAWSPGGAVWAPDAWRTSAGWVLYYSAPAEGMNGQRCIGVATAGSVTGQFTPTDTPLVCPNRALGADDPVGGRPVANAGVIDPSPFLAADGRLYLLYRTQKTPSTLRIVQLGPRGLHAASASRELRQSKGIIENPVMVQRGRSFVLFASRYGYDNCGYATVWFRSRWRLSFAGKTEHTLMNTANTGICGPGGADVAWVRDIGPRIFLHGWRCEYRTGTRNCASTTDLKHHRHFRSMYAAVLRWGPDGATPRVVRFLK